MKKLWKSFGAILAALLLFAGCKPDVEEHEHDWGTGTVTTEPTCVTKGVKTYTCTGCGKTKTEEIAALGWCESPVDAETFEAATSSSTYIYFGVFPKTVAYKDDAGKLYAADKTTEITIDETTGVNMGGNTYYKGSDGEYYAKVTENAYESSYTYTDTTTVNTSSENSTRYFKVEPIKWKVLTTSYDIDGTAGNATGVLLLAEDILTANVPYYVSYSDRTIGESTVYANNYKYSTIRAYLNGSYETDDTQTATYSNKGFLQTAFTETAQGKINTTTVVNNGLSTTDAAKNLTRADGYKADGTTSSGYTDYTCADTQDKIFLLSEQEATTTAYGFSAYDTYGTGNTRIRKTTDYAKANYAYQNSTAGCSGWWWLRSPHYDISCYARYINIDGYADDGYYVSNASGGVVPALSISF